MVVTHNTLWSIIQVDHSQEVHLLPMEVHHHTQAVECHQVCMAVDMVEATLVLADNLARKRNYGVLIRG
jgi:hypothetical protein